MGTERPEAYTVLDCVRHAVATGKRVIGATDHFSFFLERFKRRTNHYPGTPEGYRAFAREVGMAKDEFPDEILLFGPEIGLGFLSSPEAGQAFDVPEIDLFIGEAGQPPDGQTLGEYLEQGVIDIADLSARQGRPGVLGHALRGPILLYVGKTGQGPPEVPDCGQFPSLGTYDNPREHVEELLGLSITDLARQCVRHKVPIEINHGDWRRILVNNNKPFAERYLLFYRAMMDEGVRVVLGSDTHNVEQPAPTPFIVAETLGLQPRDMTFLSHWLGPAPGEDGC
jgi:hypothetical protein